MDGLNTGCSPFCSGMAGCEVYTDYDMPLAIQIFDKILESGWFYWNKKHLREFLQSGDFTRQGGFEDNV